MVILNITQIEFIYLESYYFFKGGGLADDNLYCLDLKKGEE